MTSSEEWRPVQGYANVYEVSSLGKVRSLPRATVRRDGKPLRVRGQILTANPNSRGYPRVTLNMDGTAVWATVHSLVAAAFLPSPPGLIGGHNRRHFTVNHRDGDKLNNRASNLEYITAADNVRHARATGLLDVLGTRNGRAKLTADAVQEIRRRYDAGERQVDLAASFNIDQTTVSRIVLRKSYAEIP